MRTSNIYNDKDARLISGYKNPLLVLETDLVQGFYDVLFSHTPTREVFVEGERLAGMMEEQDAHELLASFGRLSSTVQTLTAKSYMEHYLATLLRMTGFKASLLDRLVGVEIDRLLDEKRQSWISSTMHNDIQTPIH